MPTRAGSGRTHQNPITRLDPDDVPHNLQLIIQEFLETLANLDLIAFQAGIPPTAIAGATPAEKSMNLVLHCWARGIVHTLLRASATREPEGFRHFQNGRLTSILYALAKGLLDKTLSGHDRWVECAETLESLNEIDPQFLHQHFYGDLKHTCETLLAKGEWNRVELLSKCPEQLVETLGWIAPLLELLRKPREVYEKVKQHLAQRAWDEARTMLTSLVDQFPGYQDAPGLLEALQGWEARYSEGVAALGESRWDDAARALEGLSRDQPEYKDAPGLLSDLWQCRELADQGNRIIPAAHGALAATELDAAERIFMDIGDRIPDYGGALAALGYVRALRLMQKRAWREAEEKLEAVQAKAPHYKRCDELLGTLARLRSTVDELRSGFVLDPCFRWPGRCPYAVFRESGVDVTPASSKKAVGDRYYDVQKAGVSHEQRVAWDQLRSVEHRLRVDAFLLPVPRTEEVVAFLEEKCAANWVLPSAEELQTRLGRDSVPVLLLWKRHPDAIRPVELQHRNHPQELQLAHQQGLLHLAWAEEQAAQNRRGEATDSWHQAIGHWALVLSDPDYWRGWAMKRAESYGVTVSAEEPQHLLSWLEEELVRRLIPFDVDGRLRLEFRAEIAAVRCLRRTGGIPSGRRGTVMCGPLLLESLSSGDYLAQHVAQLTAAAGDVEAELLGGATAAEVRRLRQLFSSLRLSAAALLGSQPDPDAALGFLRSADCGACPMCWDPQCPVHGASTAEIRVCCGNCPHFKHRNPAYARLGDPGFSLYTDALQLAAEAHLALAARRLAQPERWDLVGATGDWRHALDLAVLWGGAERIAEAIRRTVIARAAALGQDADGHGDSGGMDRAIDLIETASRLTEANPDIVRKWGELLTSRGIWKANRDDLAGAVRDLEKAFAQIPTSLRTRDQYATALSLLAAETWAVDRQKAIQMLSRAKALVDEGLHNHPDHPKLRITRDLILATDALTQGGRGRDLLDDILKATPMEPRGPDNQDLQTAAEAWEASPDDGSLQAELLSAIETKVKQLEASGAGDERSWLFKSWRESFKQYPSLLEALDFLESQSQIRRHLDEAGLKYRAYRHRKILLTFTSDTYGAIAVSLSIRGTSAWLTCPVLAAIDLNSGLLASTLLQSLNRVMYFRPGCIPELAFLCHMPIRYLNAPRLGYLVRAMARYSDIEPAVARDAGQLSRHLEAQKVLLDLTQPLEQASPDRILSFCCTGDWRVVGQDPDRITISTPHGLVEATASSRGVRFALRLDAQTIAPAQHAVLRRVLDLNSRLGLGKLGLTLGGELYLACELPSLDADGLADCKRVFADQGGRITGELERL